jgi:hypothetical protein
VHVSDVVLEVRFASEAHGTAVEDALEDSLVGVLPKVFAKRLTTE